MTIEDIQALCHQFGGVTEDIKLGSHLCFNVGGKTFLFTSPDSVPVSASVKVPTEDFEAIISKEGLSPQEYVARYKWVHIDDINRLSWQEWEADRGKIAGEDEKGVRHLSAVPFPSDIPYFF